MSDLHTMSDGELSQYVNQGFLDDCLGCMARPECNDIDSNLCEDAFAELTRRLARLRAAATKLLDATGWLCDDAPTIEVCTDDAHKCNRFDRLRCERASALRTALGGDET